MDRCQRLGCIIDVPAPNTDSVPSVTRQAPLPSHQVVSQGVSWVLSSLVAEGRSMETFTRPDAHSRRHAPAFRPRTRRQAGTSTSVFPSNLKPLCTGQQKPFKCLRELGEGWGGTYAMGKSGASGRVTQSHLPSFQSQVPGLVPPGAGNSQPHCLEQTPWGCTEENSLRHVRPHSGTDWGCLCLSPCSLYR